MPVTEAMASGAPVVVSAHPSTGRGCRSCGGARRPGEPRGDRCSDPRGARAQRRTADARTRARATVLVASRRRGLPRGVRTIRVALDTTPLVQTRAGTARYVRALRDALGADLVELQYPATSRLRTAAADALWYPRLRVPPGADVLHCPTFRGPVRAQRERRGHGSRSRRTAAPGVVQPVDGELLAPCCPTRAAGGGAG